MTMVYEYEYDYDYELWWLLGYFLGHSIDNTSQSKSGDMSYGGYLLGYFLGHSIDRCSSSKLSWVCYLLGSFP